MHKEVLYTGNEGHGIISETRAEVESALCIHLEPIELGDLKISPGVKTDLEGFYNRPLEYVGYLIDVKHPPSEIFLDKSKKSYGMVFYMGEDSGKHYYSVIFRISRDRFYIHYKANGGRDYNRVKGVWCFNKPDKNGNKRQKKHNKKQAI